MLNRLFIVVGLLAIVLIAAAFTVPHFVDWSSYRSRMETLASAALGSEVRIRGDIEFSLLPQPGLRFGDVVVGPEEAPLAEIGEAEAEFALTDFLRDRYAITRLVLKKPTVHLIVDETGQFVTPLGLPDSVQQSKVSIADADIEDGTLSIFDARSEDIWALTAFNGHVQIADLRGPFAVQGKGQYGDDIFSLRLNTSEVNDAGFMQITGSARPEDGRFSVALDGIVETGTGLEFTGGSTIRMRPPKSDNVDEVRGDLVLEVKFVANASQMLVENYTIVPDENRPSTRLTGVGVLDFGAVWQFDATLAGGVVALAPRDATEAETAGPYELVKLLDELPSLPVPPIAGRVSVDVAELDVRAFALREVQVSARTDGQVWMLDSVSANLPGDTNLSAAGRLSQQGGRPVFSGDVVIESSRLDALALLWRRAGDNNPLFNMPGSLAGTVDFGSQVISLTEGKFVLDGVESAVAFTLTAGSAPVLGLTAEFGAYDDARSAALLALLPNVASDEAFGLSFPNGGFQISSEQAVLFDLAAKDIVASGGWSAEGLRFDRFSVRDMGGARIEVAGELAKAFTDPVLSAKGQISLDKDADAGALATLFEVLDIPENVQGFLAASLPAELAVELTPLNLSGGQILTLRGRVGVADMEFSAGLSAGLFKVGQAPLGIAALINSQSPFELTRQLGLGEVELLPDDGPVTVNLNIEGSPGNSLEVDAEVLASDDTLTFFGNIIVTDPTEIRGKGKVTFEVGDMTPMATLAGAEGVGFGGLSGSAGVSFAGLETINFEAIDAESNGNLISGTLGRNIQGGEALVTGELRVSAADVGSLAALIGGPSSMIAYAKVWPEGPFSVTNAPRQTRGRVHVDVPAFRWKGRDVATDGQFDLVWGDRAIRVRSLKASLGGGTIGLDVELCCSNNLADRQVSGRISVDNVAIASVLPKASASVVGGTLDGGASFNGSGASFTGVLDGFAGQGSFSVKDLSISRFDPTAFLALEGVDNVLELEGDALTVIIENALETNSFTAAEAGGVFSVAAGTLRISNMAIEGELGQLLGDINVSLVDFGVGGDWTLTPTQLPGSAQLITENNARVTAILSGSLDAPRHTLDLAPLIDGLKVRAYEIEVDRLEKLRAEEEARALLAAQERALLMELRARQLAEEELAKAAKEEAVRQAREDAIAEANSVGDSQDPLLLSPGETAPLDLLPDGTIDNLQPLDLTVE